MTNDIIYKIALSLIPNIGNVLAKKLIAYSGGVEAVFKQKKSSLTKIPGVGDVLASAVFNQQVFKKAEEEIKFIRKNKITPYFYLDEDYPKRLRHCNDNPILLYYKGNKSFNPSKVISIVGTRNATEYGKKNCEELIHDLALFSEDMLIISGLAYGIDICAHKTALENNIPTIAVLAHGLDKIYPSLHSSTAKKMLSCGGILSEFTSKTIPDRENFPKRNRIIAGLSDATIVVESGKKGGSIITADIANSYSRDVFAFPGRVQDNYSVGCNQLIKSNRAALIESAKDLIYIMGWEENKNKKRTQQKLFIELSEEEEQLVTIIKENGKISIDELCYQSKIPMSKASPILLNLEFSGIIRSLPGKTFQLN